MIFNLPAMVRNFFNAALVSFFTLWMGKMSNYRL